MVSILVSHPKLVLLMVAATCAPFLSYFGFHKIEIASDIRRGFAQHNGRSTQELETFANFHNISANGLEIWVILISAKNYSSTREHLIMSQELLDEVVRLDNYIRNYSTEYNNEITSFADVQSSDINYLFYWFKSAYELSTLFSNSINLTYPTASVFGHNLFLGSHLFGINENVSSTTIETVESITLWYMSNAPTLHQKHLLGCIQRGIFELSKKDNFSDIVSFHMYGDQIANTEMLRGAILTAPLFLIGVTAMVFFMLFVFVRLTILSKVMLVFAALLAPITATALCFSILGWSGVTINAIMSITPFLIMGIGVDDAFLLLHSWGRTAHIASKSARISVVLREIGPSMAITSVTNSCAFGIGILSPTTEMSAFCMCTAIAVMIDFVLEFLIFVPLMVIFYEEKDEVKLPLKVNNPIFTWANYTRLLLSPLGRITVLGLTVFLYVSATIGIHQLVPSFDPTNTFPSDSDLLTSLQNFEKITAEYGSLTYITQKMPDLSNSTQLKMYFEMVERLENRTFCYGSERTQLLLRDYVRTLQDKNESLSYDYIPKFVQEKHIEDKNIIKFSKRGGNVQIEGMTFAIVCKGELDWNKRAQRIAEARAIIDDYPMFNTSLFDYDNTIYDLISTVKNELVKAVILTFLCMLFACGVMIPSFLEASIAALSMLSISYSLLGWLSLWGQDLDPVTMINVLMAIGFSVDFSAHICYHFHANCKEVLSCEPSVRVLAVLHSVGRPMVEASLSTLICMFPLFFVPVYIIQSFARTVCLVASFGIFHGIVVIPILLFYVSPKKGVENNVEAQRMLSH